MYQSKAVCSIHYFLNMIVATSIILSKFLVIDVLTLIHVHNDYLHYHPLIWAQFGY